jgi:structural maintenance of chromosome 2
VKELEETQRGIKKINPKVTNVIDKWVFFFAVYGILMEDLTRVEKKEADLKKNIAIVEKDKVKIDETIESIDRQKRDALQTTWAKVNK